MHFMTGGPVGTSASYRIAYKRRGAAVRYGVALAASVVAFGVARYFHRPLAEISPFIVFYAAVAFSSWFGGFGPGLLAVALSSVAADYYLLEPRLDFHVYGIGPLGRLMLFVAVGTLIAWLNGQLSAANERCEYEARAARLSEARATRLAESNLIGVFFSDMDGNVHGGNDECLRLAGYGRAELVAGLINWRQITAPEHRHLDEHALEEVKQRRVSAPFEKDHLLRDGRRIPVLMGCAALHEPGDECIGFLMDLSPQRRAEADARAYQERLAALSTELVEAEERERRRIATVLHDSVGQSLALARLKVEAASHGGNGSPRELGDVENLILQVIRETRRLTSDLSPPVLYELGLLPALRWLAEQTTAQYGLPVEVRADEGGDMPGDQESVVLFEAARELIRNIVRHARATSCTISLHREANDGQRTTRLEVRDNGVGFDTAATRFAAGDHGGFGLFNIRERVKRLGGHVAIYAQPGGGTSAMIALPSISPPTGGRERGDAVERNRT